MENLRINHEKVHEVEYLIPLECVVLDEATHTCALHMDLLGSMGLWSIHRSERINSSFIPLK